jgi:hypothetical protein
MTVFYYRRSVFDRPSPAVELPHSSQKTDRVGHRPGWRGLP